MATWRVFCFAAQSRQLFRKRFIDPALISISGVTLFHSKYNVRIIRI
jgi:hypothetical protein